MTVNEEADQHLRDEFPLLFDKMQPVPIWLAEIRRAEKLLDRDDRNDPEVINEMKRQLADLKGSRSRS